MSALTPSVSGSEQPARRRSLGRRVGAIALTTGAVAGAALVVGTPGSASSNDTVAVRVTITNLAPDGGTIQTPVWAALHDGGFDVYNRDEPASPGLERLAEDGNTGPISEEFAMSGAGTDTTVFGAGGPIFPGESASHLFVVSGEEAYFSYASMVIPSNDAFVANGDPLAHQIFEDGELVTSSFTVTGAEVLDAGTEVNDEIPENTAALAQAAPDTGVVEGGVVTAHPGFLPGGNVLAAIPQGDFTEPGYENLRFDFEVTTVDTSPRTIYSVLDGTEEVPELDTSAVGYARFKIAGDASRIEVDSQFWNTEDVVAAHLHLGARGENGPVVVDLARLAGNDDLDDGVDGVTFRVGNLTGPLEGQPLAALVAEIEAGNVYINVHTVENPSGELRGQLQPTPES
ncbi:MAG: spondin domain-containing protein [Actinomycetota bacterium]